MSDECTLGRVSIERYVVPIRLLVSLLTEMPEKIVLTVSSIFGRVTSEEVIELGWAFPNKNTTHINVLHIIRCVLLYTYTYIHNWACFLIVLISTYFSASG